MARVTVEDCLKNVENRYELVHLATRRARQLYRGAQPTIECKNRVIVTALREIEAGTVLPHYAGPSEQEGVLPDLVH